MFYTILLIWIAFLKNVPQGVNDSLKATKMLQHNQLSQPATQIIQGCSLPMGNRHRAKYTGGLG